MHWDYYTFENQPATFIEEISLFMIQENKRIVNEQKNAERSIKKPKAYGR